MNYISVMAVTEEIAREQACFKTGYESETIGQALIVLDEGDNSRQKAFIFETANDVSRHPLYVRANLSDAFNLTDEAADDGPVLVFGREVTAGG